jgi:hypothetical protein
VFSSSGFLSLERQETIHTWGLTGIMSSNIVDFQGEAGKRRRVPDTTEEPSDPQYVIELEHELAELREALADKDLEFRRYRARQSKPVKRR